MLRESKTNRFERVWFVLISGSTTGAGEDSEKLPGGKILQVSKTGDPTVWIDPWEEIADQLFMNRPTEVASVSL